MQCGRPFGSRYAGFTWIHHGRVQVVEIFGFFRSWSQERACDRVVALAVGCENVGKYRSGPSGHRGFHPGMPVLYIIRLLAADEVLDGVGREADHGRADDVLGHAADTSVLDVRPFLLDDAEREGFEHCEQSAQFRYDLSTSAFTIQKGTL